MRSQRLRMGVLIVAVWTAAGPSSVSRAEQSASRAPANPTPQNAATARPNQPAAAPSAADLQKVVTQYCVGCHNSRATTSATVSGVILDKADLTRVGDSAAIWEKVIKKLHAGAMPPVGMPRPDAATQTALISYLETSLDRRAAATPNRS